MVKESIFHWDFLIFFSYQKRANFCWCVSWFRIDFLNNIKKPHTPGWGGSSIWEFSIRTTISIVKVVWSLPDMKISRMANNWNVPVSSSPLGAPPGHHGIHAASLPPRGELRLLGHFRPHVRPHLHTQTPCLLNLPGHPSEEASPGASRQGMPNPWLSGICLAHNNLSYSTNIVVTLITRNSTLNHLYCYYGIVRGAWKGGGTRERSPPKSEKIVVEIWCYFPRLYI